MLHRFLLALLVLPPFAVPAAAQQKVDFSRDVLPILADNCFKCHGPDAKARKADLRLDTRADLMKSGVVVPSRSAESELVRRVSSGDPTEQMPPPDSNKKLTPRQIATLKAWVDQGAVGGQHGAFFPVQGPAVPQVKFGANED